MRLIRFCAAGALAFSLAACAVSGTTTRSAPVDAGGSAQATAPLPVTASLDVAELVVDVPRSLSVSEASRYYPNGDIVWREDPVGDRYAQVQAIVETALQEGVDGLPKGEIPVRMIVEVTRFHALTEKARYSTGGVHDIHFTLSFRDLKTGALRGEPRLVETALEAYGGAEALNAERRGETQKLRITRHLSAVIQDQLRDIGASSVPET